MRQSERGAVHAAAAHAPSGGRRGARRRRLAPAGRRHTRPAGRDRDRPARDGRRRRGDRDHAHHQRLRPPSERVPQQRIARAIGARSRKSSITGCSSATTGRSSRSVTVTPRWRPAGRWYPASAVRRLPRRARPPRPRRAPRPCAARAARRRDHRGDAGRRAAGAAGAPPGIARALRGPRTLVEARAIGKADRRTTRVLPVDALPNLTASSSFRADPGDLAEADARAIVRELKAVGGDLRALRLALTGASRGPELWSVLAALPAEEALGRVRRARGGHRHPEPAARPRRLRSADASPRHVERRPRRAPTAARVDRRLRLRPDGLPARHIGNRGLRRLQWLARGSGAGARRAARPQHHRRQRQDLRGRARGERGARP